MVTSAETLSIFSKELSYLRRLSFFGSKVEEGLSLVWFGFFGLVAFGGGGGEVVFFGFVFF